LVLTTIEGAVPQILYPRQMHRTHAFRSLAVCPIPLLTGSILISSPDHAAGQGRAARQPVDFMHEHHVRGPGLDGRHCHNAVDRSGPFSARATAAPGRGIARHQRLEHAEERLAVIGRHVGEHAVVP
jgi:hypothetical protein